MIKNLLAVVVAGAFLTSVPVLAEDKAPAPAGEKTEKAGKDKKEKKDKSDKKDEKAGGSW
jgi:hypothetical protein